MHRSTKWLWLLVGATVAAGAQQPRAQVLPSKTSVSVGTNAQYGKECGSCHMIYPPALLPARSWQSVMTSLNEHFGETAEVDVTTRAQLIEYLVANSADTAVNRQSVAVMQSLAREEAPRRITEVPYIAGLHTSILDPLFRGNPRPKTLSECGVCHQRSDLGNFTERRFQKTDAEFRK